MSPGKPAGPAVTSAKLANGLEIVVIPDHRAPVVTHMVWYRNGSADDPVGKSGIAHFLEHLMFKGTKNHPAGEYSELLADVGGQENAFTSNDYTAYFQRVPKDHLRTCMDYEADRMQNLVLTDEVVAPEREVVLEERRMRTDSDPADLLNEAVQSALFTRHPYGLPVIGWADDIAGLGRADALAYYERFYTPENAILIVAGDVEPKDVDRACRRGLWQNPGARRGPETLARRASRRPQAHRQVTLADEKVEQPSYQVCFLVPSYRTAPRDAEALEVLAHYLGGGQTSLLFRTLVVEKKLAVSVGAYYGGTALDETRFYLYGMPAPGVSLETLDEEIAAIVAGLAEKGVDDGRYRARQVASRCRDDLCAGQSGRDGAMVWRFARHRPFARRYSELAGADRGRHGRSSAEGGALARPPARRHRLFAAGGTRSLGFK